MEEMTMQTIIFDVDDTLYDQAQSFQRTFDEVIGTEIDADTLDSLYRSSRKYSEILFDQSEKGEISVSEWQSGRFKNALKDHGIVIDDKRARVFDDTYNLKQSQITLFPEVEDLLNELSKKDVQLAILTNGETERQTMKINTLALEKWIPKDHIFISGSYGVAKPNEDIFHIVEKALATEPSQMVYVGDSFEKDIVGAKQVGWQAIWMNHRQRKPNPESGHVADVEVDNAQALYDYLLTYVSR